MKNIKSDKINTKEAIYLAAKRLYLENGFEATPITMIAKEAGINFGLVTYYYKTKDMIARDMINNNYETLHGILNNYVPENERLLLFFTFNRLHFALTDIDRNYDRFMYEMNKHDLIEDAIRNSRQIEVFKEIIALSPVIEDKDIAFECMFIEHLGAMRLLVVKQYEKLLNITKSELCELGNYMFFQTFKSALYDLDYLKKISEQSKSIVQDVLRDHPYLKETKNYLCI